VALVETLIRWGERAPLPDIAYRAAIAAFVARTDARLSAIPPGADAAFAAGMSNYPVAIHADAANEQHYELPAAFFALILGPRRKYSSCFYETPESTLAGAEVAALETTLDHAGLADGQRILELGCGWGSLSLFMAERLPRATIVAVSNSHSQRVFIEAEAASRGLRNLSVVTADMNGFAPEGRFDRIVSVEMFEHMMNWRTLLERARSWLDADGRIFLHVFTHHDASYRFDHADRSDWIAQHFFTGGIMPSQGLARAFPDIFTVEQEWRWPGSHYRRTAEDWLANLDRNRAAIDVILADVYGRDAVLWRSRWRLFFLATAGLFGHKGGSRWGVGHYRLKPV
jgi:cyclopropane-fatty-acyl-phospholipid synthase